MMIVEQMLKNAPNPLLHIADVSGSALFQGDCLDIMPLIPDNSIDCIITDPPYGTTACKWDSVIDFNLMWEQLNRIIKPNGAIVLFGSEPFSSYLRLSNIKWYKYDWIWEKGQGTNYILAKKRPLNNYETISLFSKNQSIYNPQMYLKSDYTRQRGLRMLRLSEKAKEIKSEHNISKTISMGSHLNIYGYPLAVLFYKKERNNQFVKKTFHPSQKPVALFEYLIKTYTNENELVLDNDGEKPLTPRYLPL